MSWQSLQAGATVGATGSEGGRILRDEEHDLGIRITLEEGGTSRAPYSITCGIYGLMVHTAFFPDLPVAEDAWTRMQDDLVLMGQLADKHGTLVSSSQCIGSGH